MSYAARTPALPPRQVMAELSLWLAGGLGFAATVCLTTGLLALLG